MGWVELKEEIPAAAKREVEEEAGFKINLTTFVGVYSVVKEKDGKTLHMIKFIFGGEVVDDKGVNLERGWFSFSEIKKLKENDLLWHPDALDQVKDYKKGAKNLIDIISYFNILN